MIRKKGKIYKGIRYTIIWNEDYNKYSLCYYHTHYIKNFCHRVIVLYWHRYQYYLDFWYRKDDHYPFVFKTLFSVDRSSKKKN